MVGSIERREDDFFCVEWSDNPEAGCPNCLHFPTKEEAQIFAEKKAVHFSCVWLSQLTEYKTEKSKWKEPDWVRIWWSSGTGLERMGDGWGYLMLDHSVVEFKVE